VAPQTAVQEILAGIWASALGLDRVGVHDNFFVLGGDSIRSVRIVSRAKERGLDFTVQDLFRYPTIEALAAKLETELGLRAQDGAPGEGGADVSTADDDVEATLAQLEGLSEEEVLALLKSRV
jgi:aryl carrier-like protein